MSALLAIGDRILAYAPYLIVIAMMLEAAHVGGVR